MFKSSAARIVMVENEEFYALGRFSYKQAQKFVELYGCYVSAFYFGSFPKETNFWRSNGSCFFLQGKEIFAVTCDHVVSTCELRINERGGVIQVGNLIINDLQSRIIDRDSELDICTFKISKNELRQIGKNKSALSFDKCLPRNSFQDDMTLFLLGFPGMLVKKINYQSLCLGMIGAFENIEVGCLGEDHYFLSRKPDYWQSFATKANVNFKEIVSFGGLSGCPVFFQDKIQTLLAGIVYQDSKMSDSWLVRYADFINFDGTLSRKIVIKEDNLF